jgi:predicted acylesterase/phospholipase RssA
VSALRKHADVRFVDIVGVSGGSIVGLACALDLDAASFLDIVCRHASAPVSDVDILALFEDMGLSKVQDVLRPALAEMIGSWWWTKIIETPARGRAGNPPPSTFVELAKWTGCNLVVCATDAETMKQTVFSAEATPDADVVDAIAASCAVPILFAPVAIAGRRYIDGAVAEALPAAHLLGGSLPHRDSVLVLEANHAPEQVPDKDDDNKDAPAAEGFVGYVRKLVLAVMDRASAASRGDVEALARVCRIPLPCMPMIDMLLDGLDPGAVYDIYRHGAQHGNLFAQSIRRERDELGRSDPDSLGPDADHGRRVPGPDPAHGKKTRTKNARRNKGLV